MRRLRAAPCRELRSAPSDGPGPAAPRELAALWTARLAPDRSRSRTRRCRTVNGPPYSGGSLSALAPARLGPCCQARAPRSSDRQPLEARLREEARTKPLAPDLALRRAARAGRGSSRAAALRVVDVQAAQPLEADFAVELVERPRSASSACAIVVAAREQVAAVDADAEPLAGAGRLDQLASSSKSRPSVLPAPAVFSSSSGQLSVSASASRDQLAPARFDRVVVRVAPCASPGGGPRRRPRSRRRSAARASARPATSRRISGSALAAVDQVDGVDHDRA